MRVSLGIMAYNEEGNIGQLLSLLAHETSLHEIIVIASGCTDKTEEIAKKYAKVLVQTKREGKASAINLFLQEAKGDVLILESADTLPLPGSIPKLLEPLNDPTVGAVGGHPIPLNNGASLAEHIVHLIWDLHHLTALQTPKIGEAIAFKRTFTCIPTYTLTDEASIQAIVRCQGLRVVYVPEAIFQNKGPQTMRDLIKQRRRVHLGHLYLKSEMGFDTPTLNSFATLSLLIKHGYFLRSPVGTAAAIILEGYCRQLAKRDHREKKGLDGRWEISKTTKELTC